MGYNRYITYDHGSGSTSVGTWMSLPMGETWIYKFRVDARPDLAQRIADLLRGAGDLRRALGSLAKVSPDAWVTRRRS